MSAANREVTRAPAPGHRPPLDASLAAAIGRGWQLVAAGRFAAAAHVAASVQASAAESPEALHLLAICLQATGRPAEAAARFEHLVQIEPTNAGHWVNLGTVRRALSRLEDARIAYEQAAALGAAGVDFDYNLGLLHLDRGDYEAALRALREAHVAAPLDGEIAYRYATACCETLETMAGIGALRRWPRFAGLTPELVARIGGLLVNLGDTVGAGVALNWAATAREVTPETALHLALALERLNRVEEAARWLARALPQQGSDLEQDLLLARARIAQREGRHEEAVADFRRLAEGTVDVERRHFHLYPLAQSLDALRRPEEAWAALVEAHDSQRRWIERTQAEIVARRSDTFRVTRSGCDPADTASWRHDGAPSCLDSPIFIVAFPRSGTTLLEQVLDAHPRLRSMDEQPYLQEAIAGLSAPDTHYPERMATLSPAQLENARRHYWSLVAQRVRLAPGEQLIDKNPLNILRLPAIARLFPHARILLCLRHPCDVLVSCFMQHFRAEFAWHCRDVPTLALAYRRAMEFWYAQAELLQPAVREVRYETLVADFEPEVRAIAKFLELPWTDAMLAPGEHARRKGFISTPSYAQVLQPVHARSVERWRAYRAHLDPALTELRPWLERFGYAVPAQNSR